MDDHLKLAVLRDAVANKLWPDNLNKKCVRSEVLCKLWAGLGVIARVTNTEKNETVVVKAVSKSVEAHPSFGDQRKIKSYKNEMFFYAVLARRLPLTAPVPTAVDVEHPLLIMNDISVEYPLVLHHLSVAQAKVALKWLASFHASFWGDKFPQDMSDVQGCYWHLDTRPDELAALCQQPRWKHLAIAARAIDFKLKKNAFTLNQGDFKSANIQFSDDASRCVVYDFQYVGKGACMKDVANLLIGNLELAACSERENMVRYYYKELLQCNSQVADTMSEAACLQLYSLSVLDLMRFRLGWGIYGADIQQVLTSVDSIMTDIGQGTVLPEEEYSSRLDQYYSLLK